MQSEDLVFHRQLAAFNRIRLSPQACEGWESAIANEARWRAREGRFVEDERARVRDRAARAPTDPDGFVRWFESLKQSGPGQNDPLFEFLAARAARDEMTWFLRQEMAGEAGFDDLVAMTQVKLPVRAKLELARNYWDEMGQGHAGGMHGPMLERLARALDIEVGDAVWESLALGNLMVAFAANRRYTYHSVGALGAIELTAPWRAQRVNAGLKRLGVGGEARRYFALHATLDVRHSIAWNREVIAPLVAAEPSAAHAIAEGALMRLTAGQRCFERYRAEIGATLARADALRRLQHRIVDGPCASSASARAATWGRCTCACATPGTRCACTSATPSTTASCAACSSASTTGARTSRGCAMPGTTGS
jgi:hypothetical protein